MNGYTAGPIAEEPRQGSEQSNADRRLLLVTDVGSKRHSELLTFLDYLKLPVRAENLDSKDVSKEGLVLELADRGRFSVIVFEDIRTYHSLPDDVQNQIAAYCRRFSVGIVGFLNAIDREVDIRNQYVARTEPHIEAVRFLFDAGVAKISKTNVRIPVSPDQQSNWTLFETIGGWKPFMLAESADGTEGSAAIASEATDASPRQVILGHDLSHWSMKLALLDALRFASYDGVDFGTDRYIQVDIDDIFVGQSGSRLTPPDVAALIETQRELRRYISDFSFTLGFSGYFFRRGDELENRGDEELVASAPHFHWFPHMWRHNHAHEHSKDYLVASMTQNKFFANNTNIVASLRYAVAPQHAGVFPVYEPLYDAWRTVWNVAVTSTEEYPHLRPPSRRRGFVHRSVSVLPRQTCGLFTHTYLFHAYPDGVETLQNSIFGGELFTSVLMNPFSIFMTHQQNFASDRLGAYTFLDLVRFLSCWTNMQLKWVPPLQIAERYFARFPEERTMLYTNPCSDARHRRTLPANSTCSDKILPNLIILGPQKTGTSALASFLQLHPNVSTNSPIEGSFEELQFFNGINYEKGIDWYMDKFSHLTSSQQIIFEKSANYFDSDLAPRAVKALIPDAQLVVLLMDPVDRAYSWYQHAKAHGDPVATTVNALELFTSNSSDTRRLRNRCLWPGLYARHFDRWLDHFPPSQFLMIEAKRLRETPAVVMREVVDRLGLPSDAVDFDSRLRFVERKGFYCAVKDAKDGKAKCLGQSKGRKYEPMADALRVHLQQFYAEHNRALARLLRRYNFPLPSFLHSYEVI